jgi:predicted Zn finger-like uncharacterized protein
VIIRCEKCDTRFRLDDSRIPSRGARVRCSMCKHAFFVTPAEQVPGERVHAVAAEAARRGRPSIPDATWDLRGPEREPTAAPATRRAPAPAAEDESDWEFEQRVPGPASAESAPPAPDPATRVRESNRTPFEAPSAAVSTSPAEAEEHGAEADAGESAFDGLGPPESWDLGQGASSTPPAPSELDADDLGDGDWESDLAFGEALEPSTDERAAPSSAAAPVEPTLSRRADVTALRSAPALVASALGWLAVAALTAVAAWGSLRPPASRAQGPAALGIAGLEVPELRARIVDNAAAGPILVVSGRVRNGGQELRALGAALSVSLLDERGRTLREEAATAGPALDPVRLRRDDPAELAAEQRHAAHGLAALPLAPGESVPFDAVIGEWPARAARYALAAAELPAEPRAATPAPAAALSPAGEATAPPPPASGSDEAAALAPSADDRPPRPRPSSG